MPTTTTTHINFDGDARAALDFYAQATGGQVMAITYTDANFVMDPSDADKVMWGQAQAPGGFSVMAYDVRADQSYDKGDRPFYISLRSDTEEEIRALWDGLSEGATIVQDLAPAPWGAPLYGMLTDRFGVTWALDVAVQYGG